MAGEMKLHRVSVVLFFCLAVIFSALYLPFHLGSVAQAGQTEYVIVITVDGGGSHYIQNLINQGMLPNFNRMKTEGAWTDNARSDFDNTTTLPNHVTIVTARGVLGYGSRGHLWTRNSDPTNTYPDATNSIQINNGVYVHSVFDVAHDNGLRTALYTTKPKLALFNNSYSRGNGDPDTTGPDNGKSKISAFVCNTDSMVLANSFIKAMLTQPYHYALLHFSEADICGHTHGWGSAEYNNALVAIDGYLGQIFDMVTNSPILRDKTSIIVTADHGGTGKNHAAPSNPLNYTIPFYIWGPDNDAGQNLYALNPIVRLNPGSTCPSYSAPKQPIRNGGSANLAMRMLGLDSVPDSTINNAQDLRISSNPPINGKCGSAAGRTLSEGPASDLCASGVPSSVDGKGPWVWKCIGKYLGTNAVCSTNYSRNLPGR